MDPRSILRLVGTAAKHVAAMKFIVKLYPSEEGVAVCAPALPGCWSQGATEEEALKNIKEAIQEYLDVPLEPIEGAELREVEIGA
jgi:predicted RNase H-like HicB family nuclease